MERPLFNSLEKTLFVLISFIPIINGLGFVYAGAKRLNNKWIIEGLIYEIPWFILFLFLPHDDIGTTLAMIGWIVLAVGVIRSFFVLGKINERLEDDLGFYPNIRKTSSSYWVIFSLFIFINGIGLILVGFRRNVQKWIIAGAIFEILWILYFSILYNESLIDFFVALVVICWVLSIILTILVYFKEKRMDNGIFTPYFITPTTKPKAENVSKVDVSPKPAKNIIIESEVIPEFKAYDNHIKDLKNNFDKKEENISGLINKRFTKGELSYDRFMSVIDNCHKIFYHEADSASSIIHLAPEYSERLDESAKEKIGILESINDEMNNLIEELIIHDGDDKQSDEDLKDLFDNMDNLINSVKDYK